VHKLKGPPGIVGVKCRSGETPPVASDDGRDQPMDRQRRTECPGRPRQPRRVRSRSKAPYAGPRDGERASVLFPRYIPAFRPQQSSYPYVLSRYTSLREVGTHPSLSQPLTDSPEPAPYPHVDNTSRSNRSDAMTVGRQLIGAETDVTTFNTASAQAYYVTLQAHYTCPLLFSLEPLWAQYSRISYTITSSRSPY